MAGTVGGIIENKEIGIDISLMSNNLNNTEVTSQNTIKISSVSNSEIYDSGEWISKVIDIGDNFESYGKIFSTHTDSNGSNIAIQTRTSDNSNLWSDWFPIGQDGAILSTKKRYIQIKIVFHAGYSSKTVSNGQIFDSEYIDSSGTGLKLNRTYTREMTKNGENSLYKVSSNDWKRIDKLNILPNDGTNKSLILHEGQYKKIVNQGVTYDYGSLVPKMTSDSNDELTITASGEYNTGNQAKWRVFDQSSDTNWNAGDYVTTNVWVQVNFIKERRVTSYSIQAPSTLNTTPKKFELQASNDGENFVTIDSREETFTTTLEIKTFDVNNDKFYSKYRLFIISNHDNARYIRVQQMQLFGETPVIGEVEPYWENVGNNDFDKNGFYLSIANRKTTTLEPIPMTSKIGILPDSDNGKLFSTTINLSKYIDIKNTEVK